MLNSKCIETLEPLFNIIRASRGKTIGEIKRELDIHREKMKKGAAGLIVENLLGVKNNNRDEADLPEIGCEIKVLPIKKNKDGSFKAKEPTAIQMINYFEVARESWETAKIRKKISLTFWIVYLAQENGQKLAQDDYIILDYFLDQPNAMLNSVFQKDWEEIRDYIVKGFADRLSCSMGTYIEPKTKGANNRDLTEAPDGSGGVIKARRRAFYFKKNYTETEIIPKLNLETLLRNR